MPGVSSVCAAEEWATFLHLGDKVGRHLFVSSRAHAAQPFTDFNEVRLEIERQTDRIVGNGKVVRCHACIWPTAR